MMIAIKKIEAVYTYSPSRIPNFLQNRGFSNNGGKIRLRDSRFSFSTGCGTVFTRNFSNSSSVEAANVKIYTLANAAAPLLNEVVFATKDSSYPVAMFEYFIDNVHSLTGLSWWETIVLTSLSIRTLQVYISRIIQKSTSELSSLNKEKDVFKEEMKTSQRRYPSVVAEDKTRMKELNKKIIISICIGLAKTSLRYTIHFTYFLAVWNMADKMPSFKDGGVLWFTDLSTPDSLFIVPSSMALTFLISKLNSQGRSLEEHVRIVNNIKWGFNALRVMYAFLPKALFFSGFTADLFYLSRIFGEEFMKRRNEIAEKQKDIKMMNDLITKHRFLVQTNTEMIEKLRNRADDYEEIVQKRKEDDIEMMNDQITKHKFLESSIREMGEKLLKQADDYGEIVKEFEERREKLENKGPW